MGEKLFIADAMLGKFARWIRLCGFDAFYADSSLTDSEIIGMATESDRIVITRDRELALRTGESLFIRNDDPDGQLLEFFRKYPPDPSRFFTRCTSCNGILEEMSPPYGYEMVPESVAERRLDIYICSDCHKIYWAGTHRKNIEEKIRILMEMLQNEDH